MKSALLVLLTGPCLIPLAGALPEPVWVGEPQTTSQIYRFTSNDPTPAPEVQSNPFGSPLAAISVQSPQGTGWFGPDSFFPGVDNEGTWDVGPSPGGRISVALPFAPPLVDPGLYYEVELFIYLIAYEIPVALPVISLPGLTLTEVSFSDVTVLQDTIGRYRGRTWSARTTVSGGNSLPIDFAATSAGALIDLVAIHTRYTVAGEPTLETDSFASWTARFFPGETNEAITGFTADPLSKGVPNGLRYYLGWEADDPAPSLFASGFEGGSLLFRHTRSKKILPDVTPRYEWSRDLQTWFPGGVMDGGFSIHFMTEVTDDAHPDRETVKVSAHPQGETPPVFFVRLVVQFDAP